MAEFRVLVTGSRDWEDERRIETALLAAMLPARVMNQSMIVVHGDCPTGADAIADRLARERFEVAVEKHPANWEQFGKSAGFRRNAEMVEAGADLCLAFIKDSSRGASMTAELAEKAGITTYRFREDSNG